MRLAAIFIACGIFGLILTEAARPHVRGGQRRLHPFLLKPNELVDREFAIYEGCSEEYCPSYCKPYVKGLSITNNLISSGKKIADRKFAICFSPRIFNCSGSGYCLDKYVCKCLDCPSPPPKSIQASVKQYPLCENNEDCR